MVLVVVVAVLVVLVVVVLGTRHLLPSTPPRTRTKPDWTMYISLPMSSFLQGQF